MPLPLQENETVVFTFRKHWFVLCMELLPIVLGLLLPYIVYLYLAQTDLMFQGRKLLPDLPSDVVLFASALWILLLWMKTASTITRYYLDAWIISSEHLIDIEQVGLFYRQTSVLRMDKIQDVTVETPGFFSTLLRFGNIRVQSAGDEQEFLMRGIGDPQRVREAILHQQDLVFHRQKDLGAPERRITSQFDA